MKKNILYKEREKAIEISRVSISDTAPTTAHYLSPTAFFIALPIRNHGYMFCFLHGVLYYCNFTICLYASYCILMFKLIV
jgi:hypothetical protein